MAAKHSSHWPITFCNSVAAIFNVSLPLVLVRILSVDQIGKYQVFFLYVLLCPGLFMVTGLTNGLYYWIGKYPGTKGEVRQSWTLLVLIALGACILGSVFSPLLAPLIKIPALELRVMLFAALLTLTSYFLEDLLIARGDIWAGSLYGSGFNVLKAASILAAAWWTRSVFWVFGIFCVCQGFRTMVGWILLSKTGEIDFLFSREKTDNVLRYALPVSIAGLAGIALGNIDQTILSFRLSPAKFAFFAVGCLSVPPLDIFESSVNRVMIPKLSRSFSKKAFREAAALFGDAVAELFRILLPATLGLIIYSKPIIRILFTERYMLSAQYLRLYALIFVFWSLPFDAVARARGDGGWILRTSLFFAPLSIAATWLAAGRWGAMGALIAALGSKISMRLYSLVYDRQGLGVSISKFLPWKEMVVQAILALFASAVSILLRPLFSDPRLWFAMTGPLFVLIYFGATYSINLRQLYAHVGPTRVLELTQTLGLGGLERTLYLIADRLNQSWSFNVRVAAYEQTDGEPSLAAQIQKSGIPLTQWHKGRGFSFRSVIRLVHIIFSERIRIVHAHDLGPLVYGSCAKLCSLGRVRLVLTLHTLLDIQHNRRYRFYYKVFLRFADKVIAVSPAVQAGLLDLGISPDRVEVIPNGVSFTKRALQHGESDDKLTRRRRVFPGLSPALYNTRWALSLARIHPGKGQDILLDLWRELPEETRQGMVLFFVGQETDPGFAQALREKVRNAPDSEHIVVAGSTEQPEEWLQCADIFLSGSIHEGMPLAPLEAAGAGLPVCLSDIEGHRFLQAWARYFDPAQPRIGAAKIGEILQELDSERENEFFEKRWNGASLLRERWGSNAMTASYAKLFQTGEI